MTIKFNGKEYLLTEEAYPDGTFENPIFKAIAKDKEGNTYMAIWNRIADYEDESMNADWDNPESVEEIVR